MFPFSFSPLHLTYFKQRMPARIGLLLPRSTEYPSMSFDLLDGFRTHLQLLGLDDCQVSTQNTGFGDDPGITNSAAEKLVMENNVDFIVAYATSLNAELLYPFADTCGRPIIFVDAGMEIFEAAPNPRCYHITLQGLESCIRLGKMAGSGKRSVLSAASFLDGGYRSNWAFSLGMESEGGFFSGHYVSHYQPAEFTLAPFTAQIATGQPQAVVAAFSTYLNTLFLTRLKDEPEAARSLPFYCSPFMADEQLLHGIPFPGGEFHTLLPWATSLENAANTEFLSTILAEKKKNANLFHLLGWEAATVAQQLLAPGTATLAGWSYDSPRGRVTIHPETHCAYAPLYSAQLMANADGNCSIHLTGTVDVTADDHRKLFFLKPEDGYSRWKNNYFCI